MGELTKESIVNSAQQGLAEDAVDLAVFEARDNEPLVSYEAVMKGLKVSGRL